MIRGVLGIVGSSQCPLTIKTVISVNQILSNESWRVGEGNHEISVYQKRRRSRIEFELELIQTQMAQKPMLRAEVYAHAMRASQNRKKGSA